MALWVAALVRCSVIDFVFAYFLCVWLHKHSQFLYREQLLNIGQFTLDRLVFTDSESLLGILVGGAAALYGTWGATAGSMRAKLRQRGLGTSLPSVHLANLRSLPNKVDKLLLLNRTNFARGCAHTTRSRGFQTDSHSFVWLKKMPT